jgi:hypothetical protein
MFKRYKKVSIPAQYGLVEKKIKLDDGSEVITKEAVLLRPEGDEYQYATTQLEYEIRSERVLVPERNFKRRDGSTQTFPSSYKTVTKQVVVGVKAQPPIAAINTIRFLVKRDVRKVALAELQSDYSEEQLPTFGLFGADVWYWKEVILLVLTRGVNSDLGKALGRVIPKG